MILNFDEFLLENDNPKYNGDFLTSYDGWVIRYSDYKGHYITDRLMERNKSTSTDPVKEINGLMIKLIKHLNNKNYNNEYLNWCIKFKNKKYFVIVEINLIFKTIYLFTIKSTDMSIRRDTTLVNI